MRRPLRPRVRLEDILACGVSPALGGATAGTAQVCVCRARRVLVGVTSELEVWNFEVGEARYSISGGGGDVAKRSERAMAEL